MALVSYMPVIQPQIDPIGSPRIRIPRMMSIRDEIVEEPPVEVVEDKVYVAVGKDLNESKLTVCWALHNSGGRKICILHVHEPAQRIPFMGTKIAACRMEEQHVRAYREIEKQDMNKLLQEYSTICDKSGVQADILHDEKESIEKGIVELISQHGIRNLVMGAAADKCYSKKMTEPKSKKAIYVRLQAPISCQIRFICRGHLVHTREARPGGVSREVASPTRQVSAKTEIEQSSYWRSRSSTDVWNEQLKLNSSSPHYQRTRSDASGMTMSILSPGKSECGTSHSMLTTERSFSKWDGISCRSPLNSHFSFSSAGDLAEDSALTSAERTGDGLESHAMHHSMDDHRHLSPSSVLKDGGAKDEFYDQLEQAMAEAENSRRAAFEESVRRRKAEKAAIDAYRRAKISESLYAEELRQRKETEEALVSGKEELEKIKQRVDEVMKELGVVLAQNSMLESRIAESDNMVQELEQKMFSAAEVLQKYKDERDRLQAERDNLLKVAEELRKQQAEEASNTLMPQFFSEFSFSEIEEATNNFDSSLKIGEGGYGSIYKGLLRHTQVAVKMLHDHSLQGPSEFQQEVKVLSKLRHPNLVTLVGACPEAWILVYEYLPNGSLEDRLNCRDNTPPLSWQTRIRIAAELCSVLLVLHHCTPHSIVHGDLKPANILLDENYVSKLSDFGICRVISPDELSSNNTTLCCRTDPKGTFAYMDPEFLASGELTPKSDIYSFGVILLRLLTGRPALGLTKEVQYALDKGNLKDLLDPTAGDWPFVQAKQLTHLAMRCCEMNRRSRPDLASGVWRMLEPMRVSCGVSSFQLSPD